MSHQTNPDHNVLEVGQDDHPSGSWAGFTEKAVRQAFIRKVYGILTVQLLITFGLTAITYLHQPLKLWVRSNFWAYIAAYILFIVLYIVLVCCEGARRNYPLNMIILFLFTLSMSYLVAMICAFHDIQSVLLAAGITAVCCFTVSVLSFWTKFDFTRFGWALAIATWGLFIMGLIMLVAMSITGTRFSTLNILYAGIGTVIFMLWLAFDTQLITGGGRKYELNPEEYILGALLIYMDIVQIFLFILQIVGRR